MCAPRQVELAKKSTRWVCFVCTWDERQAAIDQGIKEAKRRAKKNAAQAAMDAETEAQMGERGRFNVRATLSAIANVCCALTHVVGQVLDAIMDPAPAEKKKRKPKPKPVPSTGGQDGAPDHGVSVLLLPNANPKQVCENTGAVHCFPLCHSRSFPSSSKRSNCGNPWANTNQRSCAASHCGCTGPAPCGGRTWKTPLATCVCARFLKVATPTVALIHVVIFFATAGAAGWLLHTPA